MYLIYIIIPSAIYKKIFASEPNMKVKLKYNLETDEWYGLYGVAELKSVVDEFLRIRKKEFFVVKSINDIEDDDNKLDYTTMRSHGLIIKQFPLISGSTDTKNGKKVAKITNAYMTINEYKTIRDIDEYSLVYGYRYMGNVFETDIPNPKIFSKEIRNDLEKLLYSNFYYTTLSSTEEELAIANDHTSYGLTYPSGWQIHSFMNELQIFVDVFGDMLSS